MSDNTTQNTQTNQLKSMIITGYSITKNPDNTYAVDIKTNVHTIHYSRAEVEFGFNQTIAFPININVLSDDDNEIVFRYGLNIQKPEKKDMSDSNNKEEKSKD